MRQQHTLVHSASVSVYSATTRSMGAVEAVATGVGALGAANAGSTASRQASNRASSCAVSKKLNRSICHISAMLLRSAGHQLGSHLEG